MTYFYDIEVKPNFFLATFLSINTDDKVIDQFIQADIMKDYAKRDSILRDFKYEQFIICDVPGYPQINDFQRLGMFIEKARGMYLIGYNNSEYDDVILDYIFYNRNKFTNKSILELNADIYYFSQEVIANNLSVYTFRKFKSIKFTGKYNSIDLMKLHYLDKQRISLKQVSITLKWYKVQDYVTPYPTLEECELYGDMTQEQVAKIPSWDRYIIADHIYDMVMYNFNDVLITHKLYFAKLSELELRIELGALYKVNLLNSSRSAIADVLLKKFYEEYSGISWWDFRHLSTPDEPIKISNIYHDGLMFENSIKCDVLIGYKIGEQKDYKFKSYLRGVTLGYFKDILGERVINLTDEIAYKIIINGSGYKLMSGGLHSIDGPKRFKSNNKYIYIDADVNSYYPFMVLNYKVKPRHLTLAFFKIAEMVVVKRIEIKGRVQNGTATPQDKVGAEGLKIVANAGFFGKFGSEFSWLRDIKALVTVTINGEFNLLMFIEYLEAHDFHVVSANTDGIVTRVERDRIGLYYTLCHDWENKTNLTLEFTEYNDYCRTTVNDYYSINTKGKFKTKGDFSDQLDISKAFMHPIVPKAIKKFFIEGIPIDKTLHECTDIYDFCMSIKTGSNYINEFHEVNGSELQITRLQKNIRYYVSARGGTLLKRDKNDNSLHNMVKGYTVIIFNDFIPKPTIFDYHINYNYYKMKCMGIIDKALGNLTKDLIKTGGSLFD